MDQLEIAGIPNEPSSMEFVCDKEFMLWLRSVCSKWSDCETHEITPLYAAFCAGRPTPEEWRVLREADQWYDYNKWVRTTPGENSHDASMMKAIATLRISDRRRPLHDVYVKVEPAGVDDRAANEGRAMDETNATHDCKCWHEIDSAPCNGTVIEIKNSYGIAPYYGLYKWDGLCWQSARDPCITVMAGNRDLSWRPFSGEVSDYRDPTGGAQETPEYWQDAARRRPILVQWPS